MLWTLTMFFVCLDRSMVVRQDYVLKNHAYIAYMYFQEWTPETTKGCNFIEGIITLKKDFR